MKAGDVEWLFLTGWGVLVTDKLMGICDCRVAFATEIIHFNIYSSKIFPTTCFVWILEDCTILIIDDINY